MAVTVLLETYQLVDQQQDPDNPQVTAETYDHAYYAYDSDARTASGGAYKYYNAAYGGSPPVPGNTFQDTGTPVDAFTVPASGPGAGVAPVGTYVQVFHDGQGGVVYTPAVAPLEVRYRFATAPIPPATTGTFVAIVRGGTGPYRGQLDGGPFFDELNPAGRTGTFELDGVAVGDHVLRITDSATPAQTVDVPFTISAGPSYGCLLPRALNFDPAATMDQVPSLCVFVAVDEAPDGLVAAHLPIPVVVRASPTAAGLASIVVLVLETADDPAGPWTEFGRLRRTCDADATAAFNASEAAKSLLRIAPPVEDGPDANLSALLRIRYQVLDPLGLGDAYAGDVATCRVLNAVVPPVEGGALTTATPYASVPAGRALWRTTATLAGGVVSGALALSPDGCQPRQFVWLNAAGAFDQGFFYGRHVHGADQQNPIAYRDAPGADRYASRGVVRDTLQVYSDKLDFATYLALRGVRRSVQVYERLGPGQYVPVLVSSESYQEYQEQTDKTFTVNFTVSYPAQLIQTQ